MGPHLTFPTPSFSLEDPCSGYCGPLPRPPAHIPVAGLSADKGSKLAPCWEFLAIMETVLLVPSSRAKDLRARSPGSLSLKHRPSTRAFHSHHQSRSRCLQILVVPQPVLSMEARQLGENYRAGSGLNQVVATSCLLFFVTQQVP